MLEAAWPLIAKTWKQPAVHRVVKRYTKGGPSMPQKDNSPLKRKKALTHTTTWMNFKKKFFSCTPWQVGL